VEAGVLELGPGFDRHAVRAALLARRGTTIRYRGVLSAADIREAYWGVRAAGTPVEAQPLLAWLASHPHAPEDVQRELFAAGTREVLMSLCLNPNLHADLGRALLEHRDPEVRQHAHHVHSRRRVH
jgi:hypothetical protein